MKTEYLLKLAEAVSLNIPFNNEQEFNEFASMNNYDEKQKANLRSALKGGYLKMNFPDFLGTRRIQEQINNQGISPAQKNFYQKVLNAYNAQYGTK